jgi:hypothetical protein
MNRTAEPSAVIAGLRPSLCERFPFTPTMARAVVGNTAAATGFRPVVSTLHQSQSLLYPSVGL